MILGCLQPNDYLSSKEFFYSYQEGHIRSLRKVDKPLKINGWLLRVSKKNRFETRYIAIYAKEDNLFIDFGKGSLNFSKKEVVFSKQKNIFSLKVIFLFDNKEYLFTQKILPWDYMLNDGMFPEEICPINYALDRVEEDPEKLIKFFQSGVDGFI